MLEALFRSNLGCAGCGKIDYPEPILNRRLSVEECLAAVDECGAPMVAIPGGEPLIHKDIGAIVRGIVARKKCVSLRTNALLLEKKLDQFEPSPYLFFSVHLDVLQDQHDKSVSQKGVFDSAVSAIRAAKARGFAVNVNATIFDGHSAQDIAAFLDFAKTLDIGVSISPGYAYERAPDQEHFLSRRKTKELFRRVFALGRGKGWNLMHSALFLDFLAGNQSYHCTPWGMPTRNIFGWQKPCYLLGEGYASSFAELMETRTGMPMAPAATKSVRTAWPIAAMSRPRRRRALRTRSKPSRLRCSACGPKVRWRRKSRSRGNARRSTCSHATSRRCWRRSGSPRSGPSKRRPGTKARRAAQLSRARRSNVGTCFGCRPSAPVTA